MSIERNCGQSHLQRAKVNTCRSVLKGYVSNDTMWGREDSKICEFGSASSSFFPSAAIGHLFWEIRKLDQ